KSLMASGGEDKAVHTWDAITGSRFQTFSGHSGSVRAVAWSSEGILASASADKTVRIWGSFNKQSNFVYRGHSAGVNALAWSPDSTQIASASDDGTVQMWNAADG